MGRLGPKLSLPLSKTVMITSLVPVHLQCPSQEDPRSEGIHISSVIRAIAAESKILKPEYVESLDLVDLGQGNWWKGLSADNKLRIAIGMAWDEWYLPNLGMIIPHPGEMKVDGIYMTPDGLSLDILRVGTDANQDVAIHETKATYKSVKTVGDLSTQWMWLTQMKCYCKGAGCRIAYMHPLHLCGDYKYPITPQIGPVKGQMNAFRVEFSQREIDESWNLIIEYVQHRKRQDIEEAGLEGGV